MVILLSMLALATDAQCDRVAAQQLLSDARIDEPGAPKTHPWLIPGLALASPRTDEALHTALEEVCAEGGVTRVHTVEEPWETATWSAHSLDVTRTEQRGCVMYRQTVTLTVGVQQGAPPTYALQSRSPVTRTPIGDCPTPASWRDVSILEGNGAPVRLALVVDRDGQDITHSEVQVRRATPTGWHQQVLMAPAPPRLVGGFEGPRFAIARAGEDTIVVRTHDRRGSPEACEAVPGQSIWTWTGTSWQLHESDEARALLARFGLWRLAGEAGWLLVFGHDNEFDRTLLEARMRRLARRIPDPPLLLRSADFPNLNAGYHVITAAPFPDRESADEARKEWGRKSISYVKRAWPAPDPCATP